MSLTAGNISFICWPASSPFRTGIVMSTRITSGFSSHHGATIVHNTDDFEICFKQLSAEIRDQRVIVRDQNARTSNGHSDPPFQDF
jgi:hypothetical protein